MSDTPRYIDLHSKILDATIRVGIGKTVAPGHYCTQVSLELRHMPFSAESMRVHPQEAREAFDNFTNSFLLGERLARDLGVRRDYKNKDYPHPGLGLMSYHRKLDNGDSFLGHSVASHDIEPEHFLEKLFASGHISTDQKKEAEDFFSALRKHDRNQERPSHTDKYPRRDPFTSDGTAFGKGG